MSIKDIKLAVYPGVEVVDVTFNTAHLAYQYSFIPLCPYLGAKV